MPYITTRALIVTIILIPAVIILSKKKLLSKKPVVCIVGAVGLLLASLIAIFPVENIFVRFNTVDEIFSYTTTGQIEKIIEGEHSCLVFYKRDNDEYAQTFFLKDENGYMLSSFYSRSEIKKVNVTDKVLSICNISDTSDYYITGFLSTETDDIKLASDKGEVISDSCYFSERDIFICFVKDYTEDIYLLCGEEKIEL